MPTSKSSASSPSATTCTIYLGAVHLDTECFESRPHAGQRASFECPRYPNICRCPDAPPAALAQEKCGEGTLTDCGVDGNCSPITVDPSILAPNSTSSASITSAITCVVRDGSPIGSECSTSGPHEGQRITTSRLEHSNTCNLSRIDLGKRSEVSGDSRSFRRYLINFLGPLTRLR